MKDINRKRYLKKLKKMKFKNRFSHNKIENLSDRKEKIIVSLTSVPRRFNTLYLTIESIMNQTLKPDEIVLYLGENTKEIELPKQIKKQIKRGLIVKYVDDTKLGPHTKYFYSLQEYKKDVVITFDDDILYDDCLIEEMYKTHLKYKNSIVAVRPHKVMFNEEGKIDHYNKWIFDYNEEDAMKPNKLLCQTGVGGVLYPKNIYPKEIFNEDLINKKFKNNDDLYLYFNQLKNNIKVVRSSKKQYYLDTIDGTQENGLVATNLFGSGNDDFIAKAVKHYKINKKDFR